MTKANTFREKCSDTPLNFGVVAMTPPWTFNLANLVPELQTCAKSLHLLVYC